MTFSKSVIRFT